MKYIITMLLFLLLICLSNEQRYFNCPTGYKKECIRKWPDLHYFCKCIENENTSN